MAIQVLLLKRIDLQIGSFNYIHLFLYPLLILFIPVKTPRALLLIIAFFIGLGLDFFYDSIGIHASAALFLAYSRKYILKILEPIEGYNIEQRLTINALGFPWILTYVSILLFLYCLWYFSVEAFSFVYFKEIILRTISSFIASYVLIILFLIIFNPKN
jgi:hypothetical protein